MTSLSATVSATHTVFNQSAQLADLNLFTSNRPLQDAVALHAPALDRSALTALGAEMGSAAMQEHARLANTHKPELHTHDRVGRLMVRDRLEPTPVALHLRFLFCRTMSSPGSTSRARQSRSIAATASR